jgi:hypothetical protein
LDRFDVAWQAIHLVLLHVKNKPITIRGLLQLRNQPGLRMRLFSARSQEQQQDIITQLKKLLPVCELIMDGEMLLRPEYM